MQPPLQIAVIHHGRHDPRTRIGGVETFARTLERIFVDVRYTTPHMRRVPGAPGEPGPRVPIICDNQHVLDWPSNVPVIGFQHGVASIKMRATRSPGRWLLARRQQRAAARPNTLWVSGAEWISMKCHELYGNRAEQVIYHPIDTERFDGELTNEGSRLVLHDARTEHKGRRLIARIAEALPEWRFEPLACPPEQVPNRLRQARAFLHLSRYEGNSIVCLEAMAMNLPCLFTNVGLMLEPNRPTDVHVVDARTMFSDRKAAIEEVLTFLTSLDHWHPRPRQWVLEHASIEQARIRWRHALTSFARLTGTPLPGL